MGNQQSAQPQCAPGCSPSSSSPLMQAIAQIQSRQPNVTPDPVSVCDATKIEENQLRNKLQTISGQVDQCDPSIPFARREQEIRRQNNEFVTQYRDQSNVLADTVPDKFKTGNDLAEAVKQLKQYEKELRIELENAEKGSMKLEHDARKYRRDFLDNEPTDGVPWHIWGLQTSDDKVMLTFWITALITLSLLAHIGISMLMPNASFKDKAIRGGISVIVALILAYLLIINLG